MYLFIPCSLLPGGLKFPGWSSTNLFSSSLQYFYFKVAKQISLTNSSCQMLPMWYLAAFTEKAGGRVEGFGERHQGDDSPLAARGLLAIGPSSDPTERMLGPMASLDLWSRGDKAVNELNPVNSSGLLPRPVQLTHGNPAARGSLASQPQKSNKEMEFLLQQDHK